MCHFSSNIFDIKLIYCQGIYELWNLWINLNNIHELFFENICSSFFTSCKSLKKMKKNIEKDLFNFLFHLKSGGSLRKPFQYFCFCG